MFILKANAETLKPETLKAEIQNRLTQEATKAQKPKIVSPVGDLRLPLSTFCF
jgi:hypothetical protein